MCGIAGIWHRDGRPADRRALQLMIDALVHRGPDGEGYHVAGSIALGHRRLKVVDLSQAAAQPMWLPDRSLCLLFNGEIHNYRELATELRGAGVNLRTHSDTEVMLWAYRLWGEQCFERFNGMWAAAFWEPGREQLLLSRDRFGIKPLVHAVRGARVAFASEPKAILEAFDVERRPDQPLVRDFMAGGVPDCDEHTFFEGIRSVHPGESLRIDRRGESSRRYWNFEPGVETARPDAAAAFRALLDDAVNIRLRSDVPLGVSLSGGLDSSSVARIAVRSAASPLECFSLRYPSAALDESHYASLVADDPARYRMHWITPPAEEFLATAAAIVWHHDAPMPIRGRYPQWHVLREAARHVTVLLNGQGADEILGGYGSFVLPFALDRLDPRLENRRPRRDLGRDLFQLGRVERGIHRLLARLILVALKRRLALRRPSGLAQQWASGPVSPHRFRGGPLQEAVPRPYRSRVNNALWMELRQAGLPEVLHAEDASSMAFSLETRLPFLDHRLVELCFSLPFDDKISEGWTKLLLRRSTEDLLPPAVRWRRNKFGFPGDYAGWLAGEAGVASIRALLLEPRTLERGMLDRGWLTRRLGGSAASAARWIKQHLGETWTLVTLELWCRLFLDADRALRPATTLARPAERACTLQ